MRAAVMLLIIGAPSLFPQSFDPYDAILRLRVQSGVPAQIALAQAYYLVRQYRLFERTLTQVVAAEPSNPTPHFLLGRYQDAVLNDFPAAEASFRKVLARDANHREAHYYLGNALEAQGRADEARDHYLKSQPLPLARNGLARLALAANDPTAALAADPPDPKLRGRILLRLRRFPEAITTLRAAAAADSTDASVHYQLYRAHTQLNQKAEAATALAAFQRLSALYGSQ